MKQDPERMWRDAIALYDRGQYGPAHALLSALRPLRPHHPPLLHLLAVCRIRLGEIVAGLDELKSVVVKNKNLLLAKADLATLYNENGKIEESIQVLRESLVEHPDDLTIGLNLAITYAQAGDWDAFNELSQRLIVGTPPPEMIWMRSLICLAYRHFAEGWSHYGVRWRLPSSVWNSPRRDLGLRPIPPGTRPDGPFWLWTEQGIGDELLLATVLAEARRAGFDFVFGCNSRNLPLFQRRFPDLRVLDAATTTRADLRGIEQQMPLADLTALLRPDLASFAGQVQPYLQPDPVLRDRLRQKYQAKQPGNLLVGISWDSGKASLSRQKSTSLADWASILQTPGVTFVNLQYGYTQPILAEIRSRFGIDILHDSSINPLGPTDPAAAQIAALDFVITISNTTAHVAGALGVPGLVLLPATYGLHWYWFRDIGDSPWYPSLTLLRQSRQSDWQPVLAEAKSRLDGFLAQPR